jgi:hypothetical protein
MYPMGASYEDCNTADFLRIAPALRLALGKDHQAGAGQSMLSRLEHDILGHEAALTRSTDTLLKRKNRKGLIIDLDSTEDPAHGKQEGVAYNGLFDKNCFQPLFCFTSEGDCLRDNLRPGNVHSADAARWNLSNRWYSVIAPGSSFFGVCRRCLCQSGNLQVLRRKPYDFYHSVAVK